MKWKKESFNLVLHCFCVCFVWFAVISVARGQWVQSKNFKTGTISSISIGDTSFFVGINGVGVYRSVDRGENWVLVNSGLQSLSVSSLLWINDTLLFAGTYPGGIYRSIDNGENWSLSGLSYENIRTIASDGKTMYAISSRCYRSTDYGNSWISSDSGLKDQTLLSLTVSGETAFLGTTGGGVLRSIDKGLSWLAANEGLPKNVYPWTSFATQDTTIFMGTAGQGVFTSIDKGKSWKAVNTGIKNLQVACFGITRNAVFAGTIGGGVFRTSNNGMSWIEVNSGLTNTSVAKMSVVGDILFAGTPGSGLWKLDLTTLSTEQNVPSVDFPQLVCYPNPAINSLVVNLESQSINNTSPVNYTITTVAGEKIMEFDENEPHFSIPTGAIGNGVYCLVAVQGVKRYTTMFAVVQ